MTPEEVEAACLGAGVRLVRFLYCDNGGIVRGKATHVSRVADRVRTGIGLAIAMQAMNSLDQLQAVEGMGAVGEIRLVPDTRTFSIVPYAPHTAQMMVDQVALDGGPYAACPRTFLRRMSERLEAKGMLLRGAVENEFSLAREDDDKYVPIDESLCFSTTGLTASQDYAEALISTLETQGVRVEQYYAELGHGQQELSVAPLTVLPAADTQILVRDAIRGVATGMGLVASLAPKPWPDVAGNGGHIHFSLWDDAGDRNLFYDPDGRFGLSETAERFTAGILDHLPGLLGLTAPSYNSYLRLLPQHWSSAYTCWGPDNREASVRVASTFWGHEEGSTNLEFKPTDATCNPYLALGGLIAAGLDGIERELQPPPPIDVDPATLSEDERTAAGIARYPTTLEEALKELESDAVLTDALGEPMTRSYVTVRRSEWEAYEAADEEARFRGHFAKY